jgi:hypothetical protein
MSTRTWTAQLQEINQMLSEFPPSFSNTQKISDEDFVEVIGYGIPHSWRATMAEQGFVPFNHTLTEIVEFCNKMEYAKEMTSINNSQNNQNNRKTGQHAKADSASGDTHTSAILHAKATQGVSKKRWELIKSRCGRIFLVMSSCVTWQCVHQREQCNQPNPNHHMRGFTQDAFHKFSINIISADQFTVSIVIIDVSGWLRQEMGVHIQN